nr:PREDICTED: uncharacterized protein LOC108198228 [Daucus carota subsp. sativus]
MSDHTPEKYSNLSGGARKRISDSSDTTLEGECKRRGCRTTLDKYLLQRQNDIRNGETNPSHVESNSNRSPLSGIDNVQMAIAAAIRRRRGPNINSLFEAGSLRISDNVDKENRLRARSRTGRGPSLPDQFCISHKNKESPSNAMSTSLCELTNNASPDTLESCVSTGSAQSAVAPVKSSSVDNQNNDYTATSGVKNLFATFNEADDQRQAVNENDQTGFLPIEMWKWYLSLGPPSVQCSKCKALMWNLERNNKSNMNAAPTFSLCCKNGAVLLPPEELPPEPLASLLNGGSNSAHFRQNIRVYNNMFAMCSSGGKIDHGINKGGAPYCFKIRGMNMHFIGSLLPPDGEHPKFCQLYIYDTNNELSNRLDIVGASRDQVNIQIVRELSGMLDQHNKLVRYFRTARERFHNKELEEFKLILISSYAENGRPNLIGPSNEVAGLIVNPDADTSAVRDVVVETRHEGLKRVFEIDAFFMQLQFPLLFPFGTDGYHREIPLMKTKNTPNQTSEDNHESELDKKHRECVSMKEYYCSKLMISPSEALTPHLGGWLWQ